MNSLQIYNFFDLISSFHKTIEMKFIIQLDKAKNPTLTFMYIRYRGFMQTKLHSCVYTLEVQLLSTR